MSFTVKVKEELLNLSRFDKSELSAIIKMSGSLGLTGDGLTLSITTENAKIARHIYELIENLYHVQPEIKYHQKTNLRKNRVYNVFVVENVREILNDLQLADSFFGIEMGINPTILEDDDKGRAYLRGAFWRLEPFVIQNLENISWKFFGLPRPRRRFSEFDAKIYS